MKKSEEGSRLTVKNRFNREFLVTKIETKNVL